MEKSSLPPKINGLCDNFAEGLKSIYGNGLLSVILYGSAASGEYYKANSDINLIVVLNDAGLANIAKASAFINKSKFSLIKPLFFTEKYIINSTDVFPIEFLDMKENHLLIYGNDLLKDLDIDMKNLRFQCEQELKSMLVKMRSAYLSYRDAADRKRILLRSFTSILHLLRNILRLKGSLPPYAKADVIRKASDELGVDQAIFNKILDLKSGSPKCVSGDVESLLIDLASQIEKLTEAVDRI